MVVGSRTMWKVEVQVLSQVRDDDAMQFKKSVLDECNMVSVAVSNHYMHILQCGFLQCF